MTDELNGTVYHDTQELVTWRGTSAFRWNGGVLEQAWMSDRWEVEWRRIPDVEDPDYPYMGYPYDSGDGS